MPYTITLTADEAMTAFQALANASRSTNHGPTAALCGRFADLTIVARAAETHTCGACRCRRVGRVNPCGLDRHADICPRCDRDLDHPKARP